MQKTQKGNIIFLNGVSSAGKTTLAKALQERLDEPFYIINSDMFTSSASLMMPGKFKTRDNAGFNVFCKTLSGMHHVIKLYSDLGMNTIVDHVLVNDFNGKNPKLLEECVDLLHEYPVLFIHVSCPINELRRREKERGDRDIGQAEHFLQYLVPKDTYDLTIDTYNETQDECKERIIAALGHPDKFTAFKTLWSQRAK